jgi:NAD(P)-dependent dehydrogenase (short-subunit alcohol dehydrogenase family)
MGMALARRFGREGSAVALVARRPEALAAYAEELGAEGVTSHGFPADVTDEASLRGAFAAIRSELGDPDVLVYNASVSVPGTPGVVSVDAVLEVFKVGAVGALVALQEVLPAMLARDGGTVLVTGGGLALRPWPPATALGMSKAAVRNLALAAARDLADTGVHVATVTINGVVGSPGYAPDDIAEQFWELHRQPRGTWESERQYGT